MGRSRRALKPCFRKISGPELQIWKANAKARLQKQKLGSHCLPQIKAYTICRQQLKPARLLDRLTADNPEVFAAIDRQDMIGALVVILRAFANRSKGWTMVLIIFN